MKGIRVLLEPLIDATPIGAFVPSGTLRLQMLGAGSKSLNTEGPQEARLHFLLGFIDKARDAPPELTRFASIAGTVDVAEPREPSFTFAPGAELQFSEPPPSDGKLPHEVIVLFDTRSFFDAPDPSTQGGRLRLPEPPKTAHFAELGVELEIAGSVDSEKLDNDRLDLILREFAEITLLDEADEPMSGARYRVMVGDFEVASGELDDDGFARVEGLPRTECSVVFPDLGEASVRVLPREEVPPELL